MNYRSSHECLVGDYLVSRSVVPCMACRILLCRLVRLPVAYRSLCGCHQTTHRAADERSTTPAGGSQAHGGGEGWMVESKRTKDSFFSSKLDNDIFVCNVINSFCRIFNNFRGIFHCVKEYHRAAGSTNT